MSDSAIKPAPPDDNGTRDRIRREVERRWKARDELMVHIILYTVMMTSMWIIWFSVRGRFPWPALPMVIWGVVLLSHGWTYYSLHGGRAASRKARLEREVERELQARREAGQ